MLASYRRRSRAMVRAAGTPLYGVGIARTARTLATVAKKLAPYARAAGAKSTLQRKLGGFKVGKKKVTARKSRTVEVSTGYDAPGNDLSISKSRVGYKKKATVAGLNRLLHRSMNTHVYRFQNISQYDTTTGALPMMQYYSSLTGRNYLPFHVYDLTSFNNAPGSAFSPGRYFGWTTGTSAADVYRATLPGQAPDGTADANGYWWDQEGSGSTLPNASIMMHNWTDVRLNLYSARKRTTKFIVTFFRVRDESANPFHASTANTDLKQLVEWFTRPMIYSNLQTYETRISKKIRIVKQFTYLVPGSTTTEIDQTVGKIKEARIFLRHDKVYKLDWMQSDEASLGHTTPDGLDYVADTDNQDTPWHGSRLFMAITAFAPEKGGFAAELPVAVDATRDPSYDIIIRNSITTP